MQYKTDNSFPLHSNLELNSRLTFDFFHYKKIKLYLYLCSKI